MTLPIMLMFLFTHSYAWHENLGIDANKAAELYQTKPNDPAIVQWKIALQSAINGMGKCFILESAISCESLMSTIISNCKSHPNTLLACNDNRFTLYPSILKQAQEAQKKAEEEQKKAEEEQKEKQAKADLLRVEKDAMNIIDACIRERLNSTSNFELASSFCEGDLRFLLQKCNMTSPQYNYCKDERFVGYLKEQKILNSTVSP
jgi:hypothetical protein